MDEYPPINNEAADPAIRLRCQSLSKRAANAMLCDRYDEAASLLREALRLRPESADLLNRYGIALLRKGDSAQAEAAFQRALEISPGHVNAMNNLGNALEKKKQWDEASSLFQRAAQEAPGGHSRSAMMAQANLEACEESEEEFMTAFRQPTKKRFFAALNERRLQMPAGFLVKLGILGAVLALAAAAAEIWIQGSLPISLGAPSLGLFAACLAIAAGEEIFKCAAMTLTVRKSPWFQTAIDGALFGLALSLGFTLFAKLFLYLKLERETLWLLVSSPLLIFVSLPWGMAVGIGRLEREFRWIFTTLGLFVAILIHTLHAFVMLALPPIAGAVWAGALLIGIAFTCRQPVSAGIYLPDFRKQRPASKRRSGASLFDGEAPAGPDEPVHAGAEALFGKPGSKPAGKWIALAYLSAILVPPFGLLVGLGLLIGKNRRLRPLGLNGALLSAAFIAGWVFLFARYDIARQPNSGMRPAIAKGDWVLIEKKQPGQEPRRGDLVAIREDAKNGGLLIKRVLAKGGDWIEIEGNYVVVNGRKFDRPETLEPKPRQDIPDNLVFLADDRSIGPIGRVEFGPVEKNRIVGYARAAYSLPFDFKILKP